MASTPELAPTSTPRANVTLGQKVWAEMIIPKALAHRKKGKRPSTTTSKILRGTPVFKFGYVIKIEPDHLVVAFCTTFGKDNHLPENVPFRSRYYPVAPAEAPMRVALPAQPTGIPEWIFLGYMKVLSDLVDAYPQSAGLSEESLKTLKAAIEESGDIPEVEEP